MATIDQIPFGAGEFVENPEPRCPCLLLLDTSHSMQGQPISELNNGLVAFKDECGRVRARVALADLGVRDPCLARDRSGASSRVGTPFARNIAPSFEKRLRGGKPRSQS